MFSSICFKRGRKGFTLIELLIVIAIILILIAIALPNFLEAQIRARVTKAKGELRSMGTAMEAYFLDWKVYPAEHERDSFIRNQRGLFWLTSPIKYMTSMPTDPFASFGADEQIARGYVTYESGGIEVGPGIGTKCPACMLTYMIFSNGPDHIQDISGANPHFAQVYNNYSPTNGTNSVGSVIYWGGDGWWIGVPAETRTAAVGNPNVPLQPNIVDGVITQRRLPRF
ncbi:MAG: hypothetical protein GHCLOJNM_00346 [bacterium]|nr:hypothetical protein [bacterium]